MINLKNTPIQCLLLLLVSCGKQVTYDGTVHSKHHVPMANLIIDLRCNRDGKSPRLDAYSVVTDGAGHFAFNQKIPKSRQILEIVIHSDSAGTGGVFAMSTGGANSMQGVDIVLE